VCARTPAIDGEAVACDENGVASFEPSMMAGCLYVFELNSGRPPAGTA
jgi:hypothetical protein